jgi:demethylmenaquinone methyltransferase / 2-methoxy-6-polyprenyl-1,4-benzoquinol methylase
MDTSAKDSKKIQAMFSSIAARYDLLNRLLSLGRDRYWRRFAVSQLPKISSGAILDVATGTGDVAIEIAERYPHDVRVTGVDLSDKMIELGIEKIRRAGLQERITLGTGNVYSLDLKDNTFDAAIIAFGIRNVQDYKKGISEMGRVVKKGGKVVILEFTTMQNPVVKPFYRFYITKVLPFVGEVISGKKGAYKYLPDSMLSFPAPDRLKEIMEEAGLRDVEYHSLTFGITTVHTGIK